MTDTFFIFTSTIGTKIVRDAVRDAGSGMGMRGQFGCGVSSNIPTFSDRFY